jgi:hypothetical protein
MRQQLEYNTTLPLKREVAPEVDEIEYTPPIRRQQPGSPPVIARYTTAPVKPASPSVPTKPKPTAPSVEERTEGPAEANLSESYKSERRRMEQRLRLYQLCGRPIKGDGNCLFRAVADQLGLSPDLHHAQVRAAVVDWLRKNPSYKIDATATISDFLETDRYMTWDAYCDYMSLDGSWGDHLSLIAIAEVFKARVWIISSVETPESSSPVTIIEPRETEGKKLFLLGHWHERHYTSLIPAPATKM